MIVLPAPLRQLKQRGAGLNYVPVIARRIATGVSYAYFSRADAAAKWMVSIRGKATVRNRASGSEKYAWSLWPLRTDFR